MSMTIRLAVPTDAGALAQFAARTFRDAFAADNRPEDLEQHLAESYGLPQQSRELADANTVTLLAHRGDELAGYAQLRFGPVPACVDANAPIEVRRFYIAQEFHGQGLAQSLMSRVDEEAVRLGARTLWLGVWERNPRARAFYRNCGFVDVGSQIFVVGSDPQTDRVMARPVVAG